MNKKVLATVLMCFSLLLAAFPIVSATSAINWEEVQVLDLSGHPTHSTLSAEELLCLPEYVTANEEPPIDGIEETQGSYPPAPVHTMVIVDDDAVIFWAPFSVITGVSVYEWAVSILEVGDDPFLSSFGIDFVVSEIHYWQSPNIPANSAFCYMSALLDSLLVTWLPKPSNIDVIYMLTGQNTPPIGGIAYPALSVFIISAWTAVWSGGMPLQNAWQHEASHLYFAKDHDVSNILIACVMNYVTYVRFWCSGCKSKITTNRYRYG